MAYRVEFPRHVRRTLDRLSRTAPHDFLRIYAAIEELKNSPRPRGAQKLKARAPLYRVRVGEYRVVYAVFDPDKLISVDEIMRRTTRSYKER